MTTALTKTTAPGSYAAAGVAVTMTAADVGAGNHYACSGRDLIIAHNTGAGEHHVTITSQVNGKQRLGTITAEAIAAGDIRIYGPLPAAGWMNASRNVLCSADNAEVKFGIVTLPQ